MKAAPQLDLFAPARRAGKSAAAPRHCKGCGICDPLPAGVTWAARDRCSDCDGGQEATLGRSKASPEAPEGSVKIARGAHQTEPCPVSGCTGWRHPLATMCDACKTIIPRELLLELMRAANAERFPASRAKHGPVDRAAIQKRALEAAAKAREARAVSRATGC